MKGYELVEFMAGDLDLRKIVAKSEAFNREYPSQPMSKKDLESTILHHFWRSTDGIVFRSTLESKLGTELATRVMRGREAKIKKAMLLFIVELRRDAK